LVGIMFLSIAGIIKVYIAIPNQNGQIVSHLLLI